MKRIICILLVMCLLLGGCSAFDVGLLPEQTKAPEPTRPVSEQPEKTVEGFGLAYVPEYGFNPSDCACITNRPVLSLVYESLFVIGPTFQPEPVLCDRFAVSEDGKTYVFTLVPGVTFSDGSPLTVQDAEAIYTACL